MKNSAVCKLFNKPILDYSIDLIYSCLTPKNTLFLTTQNPHLKNGRRILYIPLNFIEKHSLLATPPLIQYRQNSQSKSETKQQHQKHPNQQHPLSLDLKYGQEMMRIENEVRVSWNQRIKQEKSYNKNVVTTKGKQQSSHFCQVGRTREKHSIEVHPHSILPPPAGNSRCCISELQQFPSGNMHIDQAKKIIGDYSYLLRDKLGRGSSSEVFRGASLKNGERVAVKVIPLPASSREAATASANQEIDVLKKLKDCSNIIQLKSAIQTKNNLYIITELCEDGTLDAQLAERRRLPEEEAVGIMEQIVTGCRELIRCGIVHRDLKPSNIFRNGTQYIIGDLGYAIQERFCSYPQKDNVGSPAYMSIQSLDENKYSHQGDIWALGVIFYQLLMGKTPWKSRTERELSKQIKQLKIQDILPKFITAGSRKFLERALVVDAGHRMTKDEFMNWSFKPKEEQQGEARARTQSDLQKPLRKTYDLHEMANLKQTLVNRSAVNLLKSPPPREDNIEKSPSGEKQRCFKIKRNESSIELAKMSDCTTTHTISTIPEIIIEEDIAETPTKLNKDFRFNSPQGTILPKEMEPFNARVKASSFTATHRSTSNLPDAFQGLLSQVQAQVNYARYLLRILRKLNDGLRTKDARVVELKQGLLYFLYAKLAEIKDLRFAKATPQQKQAFTASPQYSSMLALLGKYRERARQEGSKLGLGVAVRSEKEFLSMLGAAMGYLYSHVAAVKDNLVELERRRAVVSILEDLVALSELFLLEREEDWVKFSQTSGVAALLAKTLPETITLGYFQTVQAGFFKLAHN